MVRDLHSKKMIGKPKSYFVTAMAILDEQGRPIGALRVRPLVKKVVVRK
jgi:hypothetical protein